MQHGRYEFNARRDEKKAVSFTSPEIQRNCPSNESYYQINFRPCLAPLCTCALDKVQLTIKVKGILQELPF